MSVRVTGLTLSGPRGIVVEDVSFALGRGEALGIVGESGSGKSLTLRSIIGLLPPGIHRVSGEVFVQGRVGMVFQ